MKKVICIFIVFIFSILNIFVIIINEYNKNIAIFGNTTIVYYKNNKINKIKYTDELNNKYNYETFNVLFDNEFVKAKLIINNDNENEWYQIYNKNYEKLYPNQLIAYKGNIEMKGSIKTSDEKTELDTLNISKISKEVGFDSEPYEYKKIVFDINNDGDSEIIYYINYVDLKSKMYYYCIYLYENNSLLPINTKSYTLEQITNSEKYDLVGVIDIDLDGEKEIILSSNSGDDTPIYYHFFKYDVGSNSINEIK